jgi:hypothetical protein
MKKLGRPYPLPPLRPQHRPRSRKTAGCLMANRLNLLGAQPRAPEGPNEIIAVKHAFKPRHHH